MPTSRSPRKGSLQFWPRKRVNKFLPSVNWNAINSGKNLKGFICYKVGMGSAYVKDNTPDSMTKGKKIYLPVTILECPTMKMFSIRFYKNGKVSKEILSPNIDKELKKKLKVPKTYSKKIEDIKLEDYEDIRVIFYSQVKKTNIKKKPDVVEIGLVGTLEEKNNFIKENLTKEISVLDFFEKGQIIDLRGLTKGKGFSGPVKKFGIKLKKKKSEKGQRRPGSLGPWHPARVTFRAPQAGQLGMFTRIIYNNNILEMGSSEGKKELKGFKKFGDVKSDYIIVKGSLQGASKRQLLLTAPLRPTKKQTKKDFEFIELK
ncbi:50S ribosomal protein L3 [Candidatus Pacearchaeota archaeon]|nr:50S ribosomal protein L3 [Candidatus Pacearchaeota archaeon]